MGHPASPVQPAGERSGSLPADLLTPELADLLRRPAIVDRLSASDETVAAPTSERVASPLLHFARGASARSSKIEMQREMTFAELVQELRSHLHVGKLPVGEYLRLKAGTPAEQVRGARDKDGPWYSGWCYSAPKRNEANAREGSLIVLDFDGGMLAADEITARLGEITHVIYSTYSHSPEHPKFRAVIPLSRAITKDEHKALFRYFVSLFPEGSIDTHASDCCRIWFYPSAAADMVGHHEFRVIEGSGFCDVDGMLASCGAASATAGDLPGTFAAASPIVVNASHPNDALALPEHKQLSAEDVRRMLACIAIQDVPGQRRGRWLKVLQGVHDWAAGSDAGFQLIDSWSSTQPSYVDSEDVRRVWDSCRGHGITIASVVAMAVEGGFSFEPASDEDAVDQVPAACGAPDSSPCIGAIRDLKARIEAHIVAGDAKQVAALRELEGDLIYVTDQQAYRSLSDRLFLNTYSIRQKFKAAMPRGSNGQRLDPCKLLENSITKRLVAALDYHPGEGLIFARADGRLKLNDYARPPDPWQLAADSHVRHTVARLLAHAVLDPADASRLADKYAFLLQRTGRRIPHATVLVGEMQGTGKTFVTLDLARGLFGDWNVVKIGQQELDSDFTDYLAHAQVLCVEEIAMQHSRDARRLYNALKDPLTSSTLRIHPKGLKAYDVANHMSVFASSNYPDAVALVPKDRRWDIMAARPARLPPDLARDMRQILDSPEGCAMLRDIFLSRNIASFDIFADPPETDAKKEMEAANIGPLAEELRCMAEDRCAPFDRDFGTLEQVRAGLATRVRRLAETAPGRLGVALKLAFGAKKLRWRLGAPNTQWYWVWRNQVAWEHACEPRRVDHMRHGTPPLELVSVPAPPVSAER